MTTATEPAIVPPVTMLENLMSSLAEVMGNEDPQVLQSGIQDVIDEAARYQAMLTAGAGTGTGSGSVEVPASTQTAEAIERILTMLSETNTKTGAVLSILKKAGLLDDVSRGVAVPVRGIATAVKSGRAKKAKAKSTSVSRRIAKIVVKNRKMLKAASRRRR